MSPREHRSPWEVLGIPEDSDVAAIRRAYALKLKTHRPDEDAAAFQRLREARDAALRSAEYARLEREEEEEEKQHDEQKAAELHKPEKGSGSHTAALDTSPPGGAATQGSPPPCGEGPGVGRAPDSGSTRAPPPQPSPARGEGDAASRDSRPPGGEAAHGSPPSRGERPRVGNTAGAAVDEAAAPAHPVAAAREAIEAQFGAWAERWDYAAWCRILRLVSDTSFDERTALEWELVRRLGELIRTNAWDRVSPWNDGDVRARRALVLRLLDEEFGWSHSDRVLYQALDNEIADKLADYVRDAVASDPIIARGSVFPPRRTAGGFPLLEDRDLLAYVGDPGSKYMAYYRAARMPGRLGPAWDWVGFAIPYLPPVLCGRWLVAAALFIAALSTWLATSWLDRYPISGADGSAIGLAAVLLAHLTGALFAKRWFILSAADAIERADRKGLVLARERSEFLRHARRHYWMVGVAAVLAFIVLRAIGTAMLPSPPASAPPAQPRQTATSSLPKPDEPLTEQQERNCAYFKRYGITAKGCP